MSDRKANETAAYRALEILESIDDLFYTVDREWRLTYLTVPTAKFWGVNRDAVIGRVVWDLFPHVNFPATEGYRIFQKAYTQRVVVEDEFFSIALQRWIRVTLYPTPDGGLIVYHRDISEKHAAEEERERLLDVVRQLSEERGRLMAVAGHDLRQPLQALSYCLDKLSRLVISERDQKVFKLAMTAFNSMMLDLDMLAIGSQLDQDIAPKLEVIDLGSFLRAQADIWSFHAEAKDLKLRLVQPHLSIVSDLGMLRTILHNLVGNAIKYTSSGTILVGVRRRRGVASIEVIDRGLGIPEALQAQIFQAFKQLDNHSHGLGLGLSIVRRTAERLGHKIEMTSNKGQGSRFAVVVPIHR
jgi:signal transduction histidine kinase